MNTSEKTTDQLKAVFNEAELGITNRELVEMEDTITMCQSLQKTAFETAKTVVEALCGTPSTKIVRLKDALIKHGYFKN